MRKNRNAQTGYPQDGSQNYAPDYSQNYSQDYGQGYDPNYDPNYDPGYDPGYGQYYGQQYTQSGAPDPGYEDWNQYGQAPEPYQEPVKKRSHVGPILTGLIFYLLLIGGGFLFYRHCQENLKVVEQQLEIFESAQPDHVSQKEFETLFADPDWAALYEMAGVPDRTYEGKEAYAAYMQEKAAGKQLTCRQITFDQSAPLQYDVLLEGQRVAAFTMENRSTVAKEPDWQLGGVEVFFTPDKSFRISVPEGAAVTVNGVALNPELDMLQHSYTESLTDSSLVIPGSLVLEVRDLLLTPTVTVTDGEGQPMEVSYDEAQALFSVPVAEAAAISQQEKELALNALETYCKFMINKAGGRAGLQEYFLEGTDTYNAIVGSDLTWVQKEKAYSFADETVTDYIRYSDSLFSVRASLTWQLTRPDDSVKESRVEQSMTFEKRDGRWLCTAMTGKELTRPVVLVKLRFLEGDQILETETVDANAASISCPVVSAPEGKVFSGWMTEMQSEDGSTYYQRILIPDEGGSAKVPTGILPLKPMELYPVFTDASN